MNSVYSMFFLALQLLFIVFPHIGGNNMRSAGGEERIINGEMAQENQFPWMAAIYRQRIKQDKYPVEIDHNSGFGFACGGSILSEKVILTAAHCIYFFIERISLVKYDASSFLVGIGENDINYDRNNLREVQSVIEYPGYNNSTYRHDVSLLVFKHKIDLKQDGVATIGMCETIVGLGVSVTTAGWGITCQPSINRYHLRYAVMRTVLTDKCIPLTLNNDTDSMICAGPDTHTGSGDSGSGLWLTKDKVKTLVGLLSTSAPCERLNLPQSFVRLSTYREWVLEMIGKA